MMNKYYAEFILTDLLDEQQLRQAYALMSEERRLRCDKMRSEQDRRACICADMLIRRLAERHLGLSAEKVELCADEKGKPYIKDADCHISISHSGNLVLCALSPCPIGVDVERIGVPPQKIAERLEQKFESNEHFYQFWTAAESYGKLTGEGVWWALKQDFLNNKELNFEHIPCPEGYVATVCVNSDKYHYRTKMLQTATVLKYSNSTTRDIMNLFGSVLPEDKEKVAKQAIFIVENSKTEQEAYNRIKQLIEQTK